MNSEKQSKNKWLHLRLAAGEHKYIHEQFTKTACRKLSEYARKVLLNKPVTTLHRDQSLDDLMTELIHLNNELNSIGNNFNQAVKKLHTLQQIAEFKAWIVAYERDNKLMIEKTEEIKKYIQKIGEKWLL